MPLRQGEGLLIFDDYNKRSYYEDCYYGVIPVVNDLILLGSAGSVTCTATLL